MRCTFCVPLLVIDVVDNSDFEAKMPGRGWSNGLPLLLGLLRLCLTNPTILAGTRTRASPARKPTLFLLAGSNTIVNLLDVVVELTVTVNPPTPTPCFDHTSQDVNVSLS